MPQEPGQVRWVVVFFEIKSQKMINYSVIPIILTMETKLITAVLRAARDCRKRGDYNEMKHYYLVAIEAGNVDAMFLLGLHYQTVNKKPGSMEKYYRMAIAKARHAPSWRNLGLYHKTVTKNYEEMQMCLFEAIEQRDYLAMKYFAEYHYEITKDFEVSQKYAFMAMDMCPTYNLLEIKMDFINEMQLYDKPSYYRLLRDQKIGIIWHIDFKDLDTFASENTTVNKYKEKHCAHISVFNRTKKEADCPICLKLTTVMMTICGHDCCDECLLQLDKCAICRCEFRGHYVGTQKRKRDDDD
jgi:tetratricopeptide (TPR) repeat protein